MNRWLSFLGLETNILIVDNIYHYIFSQHFNVKDTVVYKKAQSLRKTIYNPFTKMVTISYMYLQGLSRTFKCVCK